MCVLGPVRVSQCQGSSGNLGVLSLFLIGVKQGLRLFYISAFTACYHTMKRNNHSGRGWRNSSAKQPRLSPRQHAASLSIGIGLGLSSQPCMSASCRSPRSTTQKYYLAKPAVSSVIGESGTGGPLFIPDEVLQVVKSEADEDGARKRTMRRRRRKITWRDSDH
ncbi:hypothetical protein KIL84_004084 [Mauremys mutica]|uniref:Uncharacterized protein n=1 Tax=Mauremys mutica TaxID=74926 RepID=A0A9D4AZQ1_9SAUR|nr:hypothetical protein KIL84_004084 [Mauremys mutica]